MWLQRVWWDLWGTQGVLPNPAWGWLPEWRMHKDINYAKGLCSAQLRGAEQERERKPWDSGPVFRPQKQPVVSDNNIIQQCEQEIVHAFLQIHVITAHGVHLWCWAPYPTCFWLNFLTTPQCCRDVAVLRPKYCLDVKSAWRTLRVPPALYHCCVGLAPCLLRGFRSAMHNNCLTQSHTDILLSSPCWMWAGVSCVPGYLYSLVLWHCFGAVTLAVWSRAP